METQFDLHRYLSILRRRWLYVVVPALLVAIGSIAFAYATPPVYEATATILVESQQIPTDLASPTVTSDAAERIRVIEQRLLTRDNLLQIAGKYALYQYLGTDLSPTTIVENVRRAVSISQINTPNVSGPNRVVGFTVAFEYRDASTAARVTNDLVTSILSQNVESRLNRASETSAFFAQQKTELEKRLLELEHKIADFKRTNEADLPETLAVRREQLAQLRLQLVEFDQKIRIAKSSDALGVPIGENGTRQLGFTLEAKELDLQSLREQQADLTPLAEKGFVPTNRMRDLERQIAGVELDIKAIKAQIADAGGDTSNDELEAQRAELSDQINALNDSILRSPLIQVELNTMERDYESLQGEYRQAQAKFENAQTGERLEQDRQSERFEVIEQATVPDMPSSPDRPKIMLAGVAGGLAAGVGFIALRQVLDRGVYAATDIERALQMRPIAVVPYVKTKREKRSSRLRWLLFILAVLVAIAAALYLIDTYYLPLDLVMERTFERVRQFLVARGMMS